MQLRLSSMRRAATGMAGCAWADAAAATGVSFVAAAALLLGVPAAHAAADAQAVFEKSCAGCHSGGGNIIR